MLPLVLTAMQAPHRRHGWAAAPGGKSWRRTPRAGSCGRGTKLRCAHLPQNLWVADVALVDLVKGQVILALPQLLLVRCALDGNGATDCQEGERAAEAVP